jgi:hypothetical protein
MFSGPLYYIRHAGFGISGKTANKSTIRYEQAGFGGLLKHSRS